VGGQHLALGLIPLPFTKRPMKAAGQQELAFLFEIDAFGIDGDCHPSPKLCHSERALGARVFISARVARRNRLPRLAALAWPPAQHRPGLCFRNSLPGLTFHPLGAQPRPPGRAVFACWGGHIGPARIHRQEQLQLLLPRQPLIFFSRSITLRGGKIPETGFGRSRFLTPTGALKTTRARLTGFRNDTLMNRICRMA